MIIEIILLILGLLLGLALGYWIGNKIGIFKRDKFWEAELPGHRKDAILLQW